MTLARPWYLCTPYRAYLGDQGPLDPEIRFELAFEAATRFTARLLDCGVEVYSPIVHSHPIAKHVTVADPSSDYWLQRQVPFLNACRGLIVAKMSGWEVSSGIRWERDYASVAGKPIVMLDENFEDLPGILR